MFEEEEEEPDAEDEQAAVPANPLASMLAAYEDSGEEEAAYDEADEMARVRQENEQAFGADSDAEKDDASAGASHSAPDPQEEDNLEEWDGTVPPDAHPIAVELHCKISLVFGQNLAGGEPDWGAASDYGAFESDEAMRYGFNGEDVHLDKTPFDVFAEHGHEGTAEYKAPYTHKKEGILFPKLGTSGEKYGEWDAFTLFHPVPASGTSLEKVEFAQEVNVGPAFPDGEVGIVLRILRGTKAAGRAADAKTQLCYLVLLLVGKKLKYAALQHIGPTDWTKGVFTTARNPASEHTGLSQRCRTGFQRKLQLQAKKPLSMSKPSIEKSKKRVMEVTRVKAGALLRSARGRGTPNEMHLKSHGRSTEHSDTFLGCCNDVFHVC